MQLRRRRLAVAALAAAPAAITVVAWNLHTNGTMSNAQSGICLDVTGNTTANGSSVVLRTGTAAANQPWSRR